MTTISFRDLALAEPLQRALAAVEYTVPTPIQAEAIPHLLAGRDLLGCAQTGTGKTAAFALPILHRLDQERANAVPKRPRVLVLSPTRELAAQIGESFRTYGRFLPIRHTVVFGGVGQNPQVRALSQGVHVLVATPGRLLDLMQQGHIRLDRLSTFVLDEADRMLDMGFLPDLRRIIASLPKERQSLFFSATLPAEIAKLSETLLTDAVRVEVTPHSTTADRIEQRVLHVAQPEKRNVLEALLRGDALSHVLVFTRTKHRADLVARQLAKAGVGAEAIHGNKSQGARERALRAFRSGRTRVLVATDLAARGLDVDGISHVINFDVPADAESYVHRIGRTARAGASGIALTFCDASERGSLRAIERLIGQRIAVDAAHPAGPGTAPAPPSQSARRRPSRPVQQQQRRRKPRPVGRA